MEKPGTPENAKSFSLGFHRRRLNRPIPDTTVCFVFTDNRILENVCFLIITVEKT